MLRHLVVVTTTHSISQKKVHRVTLYNDRYIPFKIVPPLKLSKLNEPKKTRYYSSLTLIFVLSYSQSHLLDWIPRHFFVSSLVYTINTVWSQIANKAKSRYLFRFVVSTYFPYVHVFLSEMKKSFIDFVSYVYQLIFDFIPIYYIGWSLQFYFIK